MRKSCTKTAQKLPARKLHERNRALFRDVWNMLDAAVCAKKSHWEETAKEQKRIFEQYKGCEYAEALLMATLKELERARRAGDLPW